MRSVGRSLLAGAAFGVFAAGTVALVEWRPPDPLDIVWVGLSFTIFLGAFEFADRKVGRPLLVFLIYAIAIAAFLAGGALIWGDEVSLVVHLAVPLGVASALTALDVLAKRSRLWAERKQNELRPEPGSE